MEGRREGACGRDRMIVARRVDERWCSLKTSCNNVFILTQAFIQTSAQAPSQNMGPVDRTQLSARNVSVLRNFSACYLLRPIEAACRSVKVVPI